MLKFVVLANVLNICLPVVLAFPSLNRPSLVSRDAPPPPLPQSSACGDIVRETEKNTFNASLVYECLTSVPFEAGVATKFLKYYRDTVQFHSTIDILKNPPQSYRQPAFDLLSNLDRLQGEIDTQQFTNQYEFEAALQSIVYGAHDDHLSLSAGLLGVFTFGSSFRIAAVSSDGIELPKVFFVVDLVQATRNTSFEPSPIVKINDRDSNDFLVEFAARNSIGGREAHTEWNLLMVSPAQVIQSIPSVWGGGATFYPGEFLKIELLNTSIIETPWYGVFHGDSETGPLETGGDFYNSFVLGLYPASYEVPTDDDEEGTVFEEVKNTAKPTTTSAAPVVAPSPTKWNNIAYPTADLAQYDLGTFGGGFLSAYYLEDPAIAVLSVPSFQEWGDAIDTYSAFVGVFIKETKAKGVKKVVIDLQRNYGGDALLATDMYKQFCPTKEPFAGSRMRAHDSANIIGSTLTEHFQSVSEDDTDHIYLYSNEWVAATRLNAETGAQFGSWEEFYGPRPFNGGNFTTPQRYNLSDNLFNTLATGAYDDGFSIYGYGNRIAELSQPFAADDIILLTDGVCSSTCSLFVEMMHHEAGVKIVVAGGSSEIGPMQAVGLSRGAASYRVTTQLDSDISDAQIVLTFNNLSSNFLPDRIDALDVEVYDANINLRDQVREDDSMPLQFKYDAADCRIFFTPKTVFNYTALWHYAAAAVWTRPELCVAGSTGQATSAENDTTLPHTPIIPAQSQIQTPPLKVGALIKSFVDPDSSIEAGVKPKDSPKGKKPPPNLTGTKCTLDAASELYECPENYFCDLGYYACDPKRPGWKFKRPGCVKRCEHTKVARKCKGTSGASCVPRPGAPKDTTLDQTYRGFCKIDTSYAALSCDDEKTSSIQPGGAGKPGKGGGT